MKKWIQSLDRILRGEATRLPQLQQGAIDIPVGGLSFLMLLLGMFYGACMGVSAVIGRWPTDKRYMGCEQMLASMAKVPMLYFLTLVVTFPSLYVFNALVGSRLSMLSVLRLLIASGGVMLAVLASFGPIVGFFAVSTTSYPFMQLLNVIVFSIAGFLSLAFLLRTLDRLSIAQEMEEFAQSSPPPEADAPDAPDAEEMPVAAQPPMRSWAATPGPLEKGHDRPTAKHISTIFRIWVCVFGLVGAQMSWVLRPFIGNPDSDFTFFRPRASNFFEALFDVAVRLMTGGSNGWHR